MQLKTSKELHLNQMQKMKKNNKLKVIEKKNAFIVFFLRLDRKILCHDVSYIYYMSIYKVSGIF